MSNPDNQEILTKAIKKAISGGWNYLSFIDWDKNWSEPSNKVAQVMAEFYESYDGEEDAVFELDRVYMMIYIHDFAKALWGEAEYINVPDYGQVAKKLGWREHLQQMVIADDPIKYLGENI